jgi:hypothetical protein
LSSWRGLIVAGGAYPIERFPIIIPNLQKYRARIAKQFNLTHDVMRHSFISYFVAKYRSVGEAALQAGNSESITRRHYLDLKTAAEAEQFFGILPRHGVAPSLPAAAALPVATEALESDRPRRRHAA